MKYIGKVSVTKTFNSKMLVMALIMLATAWQYDKPYLAFVKQVNHPISWCIFPFFLASHQYLAIFYFCIIYINSDVPFMQHMNLYQVIRVGRGRWAAGQAAMVFFRSFFAVILAAVTAALPFLGRLELTNEWGKVIYTLADNNGNLAEEFSQGNFLDFAFYYEILDKFTPLQLMGVCISLCVLICTLLGLIMFLISLFADRVFAAAGAFAFAIMLYFVQNAPVKMRQSIAHFVPAYWAAFALSATPHNGYYRLPSLTYMYTVLFAAIMAVLAVIFFRVKHIEFDWEKEDE